MKVYVVLTLGNEDDEDGEIIADVFKTKEDAQEKLKTTYCNYGRVQEFELQE